MFAMATQDDEKEPWWDRVLMPVYYLLALIASWILGNDE